MHAQNRVVPRALAGDDTPGFKVTAEEPESKFLRMQIAVERWCFFKIDCPVHCSEKRECPGLIESWDALGTALPRKLLNHRLRSDPHWGNGSCVPVAERLG
jgi:hypothetical protein